MSSINSQFFTDLYATHSRLQKVNSSEADMFFQEIQLCQKHSQGSPEEARAAIRHLSQRVEALSEIIRETLVSLVEKEHERLNKVIALSYKHTVEETGSDESPQRKRTAFAQAPTEDREQREVQEITEIVTELDGNPARALSHFNKLFPYFLSPEIIESFPYDINAAIECLAMHLKAALKTNRFALRSLPLDQKRELVIIKSELACLLDEARLRKAGGFVRSENKILLPLTQDLATRWKQPRSKPILEIPAYLFFFPHALDSTEDNNFQKIDGVFYFNTNDPWTRALKFVEHDVLPRPLAGCTKQELQALLCKIQGLLSDGGANAFRDGELIVYPPGQVNIPLQQFVEIFKESEPETSRAIQDVIEIVSRWGSVEAATQYFTPQHWNAWRRVGYMAPAPDMIPMLLDQFLEHLVLLMKNTSLHPYQIASFIHYGLTSIHPFGDGNGRLSRLMANIYLMQQGIPPFFVLIDRVYSCIATFSPDKYQQAFGDFIEETNKKIAILAGQGRLPLERHETTRPPSVECPLM